MKNHVLFLLLISAILLSCQDDDDPQTQTLELQVDGYTPGDTKAFNAGFVSGETAEVTLGPVAQTFQVTHVQFFFGGAGPNPVTRNVILTIYKDTGVATPGDLLFTSTYNVTSSDTLLQQVDLHAEDIVMEGGGSIRVAIGMTEDGLPSVARDNDGSISSTANWIGTGGTWLSAMSLGLTGDFIIRATVEENL